jgi:Amt family ammonium transporter
VSGCLAERTFVDTYIVFSIIITGFVYPIVAAWSWGGGWLSVLGFHDYAGSANIHMLGGLCGFIGTVFLGPRLGIFGKKI